MSCPLLRLPLEIRNKIWIEVLGDRLVHLRYLYDDDLSFETNEEVYSRMRWSEELKEGYGSAWRHLVCKEDCPENQEDRKLTTSKGEVLSIRSHFSCESDLNYDPIKPNMIYEDWYGDDHEMMRLSVLRSCRQIYVEANKILWTTNTFSFADAVTFKRFMMTRTINQKRSIKSLRLQMDWDFYNEKEWNSALNMPLVRSMSGLRRLRLQIDHQREATSYDYAKSHNLLDMTAYCESLQKVSTLPLTEVEIVVKNPQFMPEDDLWTKVDREEFAEGLRAILLNPRGAEIYAADQLKRKEACRKERERDAEIKASYAADQLKWKEKCRKEQERDAEIEASLSRPRLQAAAGGMIDSPLAGPSE